MIRCPRRIGIDQNAAFHAAVACSARAISCDRGSEHRCDRLVDGGLTFRCLIGGLVAADHRLTAQVIDLRVEDDLREAGTTRSG